MKLKLLTAILFFMFIKINAQFVSMHSFSGINGVDPLGDLLADGNSFYGMTNHGGANDYGTIFKIQKNGTGMTTLLDFNVANGGWPRGSLISDGTFLYGMTSYGGINNAGTIFKIKPDGTAFNTLMSFSGTDGSSPKGSLIFDGTFLYGMTGYGGIYSEGTVFKIKPDGTGYIKLYDFYSSATDGGNPLGSLVSDGSFLYGMTYNNGVTGGGTIFKIKTDGTGYAKLYDFDFLSLDGIQPFGSLILDGTFLYGMNSQAGANNGTNQSAGTIFKIHTDGTGYIKLLNFNDCNVTTGGDPYGSLIFDGTFLYGMTTYGGSMASMGTIFKIKTDGSVYVKMHTFSGSDGANPFGSLIMDNNILYGTTAAGGSSDNGTIFKYGLVTGINEKESTVDAITIFPNPTNSGISIKSTLDYNSIKIINSIGQTVITKENKSEPISVSNLSNGIYFIQLLDKKGSLLKTEKFIKE